MNFIKKTAPEIHRSDEELLADFTNTGNLKVLGDLYSEYMHLVYGVCLRYLKSREDSRDAVMQIFEKLIADIPKQQIDNFKNWLYIVTKNYCLMKLRASKTDMEKALEWKVYFMENSLELHPIDETGHDVVLELENCIEKLKNEQKQCIREFYFGNRCYQEIAEKMDLDEKKVKSHLQNAKRNLKICLEEKNVRQE